MVHALLGDFAAASADLEVFVDALEAAEDPNLAPYLEKRRRWLDDLRAGVNPFTPEVLAELRAE